MSGPSSPDPGAFLTNVHLFRGAAILAVVATHVLFELDWTDEHQREFKVCLSLVQNGTVWFVFVAGLLFRHLSFRFDYRRYLDSKIRYVVLPYILISLPFVFLQHARGFGIFGPDERWTFSSPVLHVLSKYLTGEQMPIPLWFIPMISVLYLAAPLLLWLDRQRWGYWTIPPLLLLASFIHRPLNQTVLRQTVVYFLPVYLIGMWVARNMSLVMEIARKFRIEMLLGSLAVLVYEVATRVRPGAIESAGAFSTEMGVFDVNIYMKLLLAMVVLEALQRCPNWLEKVLDPLATLSFGIFFVHFYWLYFARDLRSAFATSWPGNPFVLALVTGAATLLSALFVSLLRRLLGAKSRMLVGC